MNRLNLFRGIIALSAFGTGMLADQAMAAEATTLQIPAENVVYYDPATEHVNVQLVKAIGRWQSPA